MASWGGNEGKAFTRVNVPGGRGGGSWEFRSRLRQKRSSGRWKKAARHGRARRIEATGNTNEAIILPYGAEHRGVS